MLQLKLVIVIIGLRTKPNFFDDGLYLFLGGRVYPQNATPARNDALGKMKADCNVSFKPKA